MSSPPLWVTVCGALGIGGGLMKLAEYLLALPGKRMEQQVSIRLRGMDDAAAVRSELHAMAQEEYQKRLHAEEQCRDWERQFRESDRLRREAEQKLVGYEWLAAQLKEQAQQVKE